MQTLSLGDTLALYINRTDLAALGLTPTEHDLATLARRALAERGTSGDADITLEVYPGSAAAGDLLLFCSPLTRETVAFPTLAAAIEAARTLTHRGRGSLPCSERFRPDSRPAEKMPPDGIFSGRSSSTMPASQPLSPRPSSEPLAAQTTLHLTDTNLWLLTLRATPRRAALLASIAAEFGERVSISPACLAEHAKLLIAQNALETLSQL